MVEINGTLKRINLGKYRFGAKHTININTMVTFQTRAREQNIYNNHTRASSNDVKAPNKSKFPKTRN